MSIFPLLSKRNSLKTAYIAAWLNPVPKLCFHDCKCTESKYTETVGYKFLLWWLHIRLFRNLPLALPTTHCLILFWNRRKVSLHLLLEKSLRHVKNPTQHEWDALSAKFPGLCFSPVIFSCFATRWLWLLNQADSKRCCGSRLATCSSNILNQAMEPY
jgi:hypothetical protein